MIIATFILSAIAGVILYIVSIVALYYSVVFMRLLLNNIAPRIEQFWTEIKLYTKKVWISFKRMLSKTWTKTKKLIFSTIVFLFEKYSLFRVFVDKNINELFILVKLLMVVGVFVSGIVFYVKQQTITWANLFTCSHWMYLVFSLFVTIMCYIIIKRKLTFVYESELQNLQKDYQEFSDFQISWLDVWLRVIEHYANLLNSIWDTFMGLLLPCILFLYGYSIVSETHIDFKDMLGVSMTIISVLLALFSLAFARDVKRESDEKTQVMMDKLDQFWDIAKLPPDDIRKEQIIIME